MLRVRSGLLSRVVPVLLVASASCVVGCGGEALSEVDGSSSGDSGGSGGRQGNLTGGAGGVNTTGGSGGVAVGGMAATGGSGGVVDCLDSDGDGIDDTHDGWSPNTDTDFDSVPDYLDTDSDDDGLLDAEEAGIHGYCESGRDTDGDGTPDFRDTDSDWDYVSDADELTNGLSPVWQDTDGDGCGDLEEFTFGGCHPENFLVYQDWCSGSVSGTVAVQLRADVPAGLDDLSLAFVPGDRNRGAGEPGFELLFLDPKDGGTIVANQLESINPGTQLVVSFWLDPRDEREQSQWDFQVWSESYGLIGFARVLWVLTGCLKV